MSYKTAGDGGRGLGWHQLNYFVNTSFVNQMVNKFSVFFVNQMVYYIYLKGVGGGPLFPKLDVKMSPKM